MRERFLFRLFLFVTVSAGSVLTGKTVIELNKNVREKHRKKKQICGMINHTREEKRAEHHDAGLYSVTSEKSERK